MTHDNHPTTPTRLMLLTALLILPGCALCPSMDDNCWLIKEMNGEHPGAAAHLTPKDSCDMRGGTAILEAGEYARCSDGK